MEAEQQEWDWPAANGMVQQAGESDCEPDLLKSWWMNAMTSKRRMDSEEAKLLGCLSMAV